MSPDSKSSTQVAEKKSVLEFGRKPRFALGIIALALLAILITAFGNQRLKIDPYLSGASYAVFVLTQGILIAWLSSILGRLHDVSKAKFSIGALLIITTMIALPFGLASFLGQFADPKRLEILRRDGGTTSIVMMCVLGLPMFFVSLLCVCEAVVIWLREPAR